MDALNYIVEKHHLNLDQSMPITIPHLSRIGLADLFAELGFKRGVEIGVQNGRYSKVLCDANPGVEFYGIDPWEDYSEFAIRCDQEQYNAGYENAKALLPENCTLIRKKSMDAVHDFADGYFDFVYIDGNHEFYSVAQDIFWWLRKIRSGGIIAGHDYRRYYPKSFIHVYQVVNAYTEAYGIKPWFVTDYEVEKVRSFFWVKS